MYVVYACIYVILVMFLSLFSNMFLHHFVCSPFNSIVFYVIQMHLTDACR